MGHDDGMEAQDLVLNSRVQDAEAELVRSAKALLPEAWQEIYQRYYKKMYTYIYCQLNDRASAEDLASQVFLEAFRSIRSFTYRGVPLASWLYKIAHNLSTDFLRRRRRLAFQPLDEASATSGSSRDDWDIVDQWAALAAVLPKLTLEQQQVVVLRFVDGLPLASVAATLGKTEEAVKALQHRALASLRRHLGPQEGAQAG